ncbi:hypothetical protein ACVDFE_15445 [Lentzea chajnantorensis]
MAGTDVPGTPVDADMANTPVGADAPGEHSPAGHGEHDPADGVGGQITTSTGVVGARVTTATDEVGRHEEVDR